MRLSRIFGRSGELSCQDGNGCSGVPLGEEFGIYANGYTDSSFMPRRRSGTREGGIATGVLMGVGGLLSHHRGE